MKAVFLDWTTMDLGLDLSRQRKVLPELEVFDATTDEQAASSINDACYVIAKKIHLSDS